MRYRRCDVQHTLSKKHVECFLEFLSSRGYLITAIDDYKLVFKLEKDGFVRYLSDLDFNSAGCSRLLKDKLFTYLVLEQLGIDVPKGTYFLLGNHQYSDSTDHIVESLKHLKYPLVTKPNDSSLGKGITILTDFSEERIRKAISRVKQYSDILLAQNYLSGQEYRVVAVEGEIVIALEKHDTPAPPREISLPESAVFLDIISRTMEHLGATVCGYDFMVENGSVRVLEINSNPFVFRVKKYLSDSTVEQYFIRLEEILRRNYGHGAQTPTRLW